MRIPDWMNKAGRWAVTHNINGQSVEATPEAAAVALVCFILGRAASQRAFDDRDPLTFDEQEVDYHLTALEHLYDSWLTSATQAEEQRRTVAGNKPMLIAHESVIREAISKAGFPDQTRASLSSGENVRKISKALLVGNLYGANLNAATIVALINPERRAVVRQAYADFVRKAMGATSFMWPIINHLNTESLPVPSNVLQRALEEVPEWMQVPFPWRSRPAAPTPPKTLSEGRPSLWGGALILGLIAAGVAGGYMALLRPSPPTSSLTFEGAPPTPLASVESDYTINLGALGGSSPIKLPANMSTSNCVEPRTSAAEQVLWMACDFSDATTRSVVVTAPRSSVNFSGRAWSVLLSTIRPLMTPETAKQAALKRSPGMAITVISANSRVDSKTKTAMLDYEYTVPSLAGVFGCSTVTELVASVPVTVATCGLHTPSFDAHVAAERVAATIKRPSSDLIPGTSESSVDETLRTVLVQHANAGTWVDTVRRGVLQSAKESCASTYLTPPHDLNAWARCYEESMAQSYANINAAITASTADATGT